mgnify:CR=1 FL=1
MDQDSAAMLVMVLWLLLAICGCLIGSYARGRPILGFVLGLLLGVIGWGLVLVFSDKRYVCIVCRRSLGGRVRFCPECGADQRFFNQQTPPPVPGRSVPPRHDVCQRCSRNSTNCHSIGGSPRSSSENNNP